MLRFILELAVYARAERVRAFLFGLFTGWWSS